MKNENLINQLVLARKNKKLTHQEVVELTGNKITRQYYGMIENGERTPSPEVAKLIADVLNIEWTIFFDHGSNETFTSGKQEVS